jgi:hypothetical protein
MQKIKNARGVNDTACKICHRMQDRWTNRTALAVFKGNIYQKHALKNRSYLGEFEAEFKKALARESGAQGVLFDEKNRRSKKSNDTVPLIYKMDSSDFNVAAVARTLSEHFSVSHTL